MPRGEHRSDGSKCATCGKYIHFCLRDGWTVRTYFAGQMTLCFSCEEFTLEIDLPRHTGGYWRVAAARAGEEPREVAEDTSSNRVDAICRISKVLAGCGFFDLLSADTINASMIIAVASAQREVDNLSPPPELGCHQL